MNNRPYTHPSEILLAEFVKPYGLTQKQLCERLGVGIKTISEIYNKKRGISPVTVYFTAKTIGYKTQLSVVHINTTLPGNASYVDTECISLVDVVIKHSSK